MDSKFSRIHRKSQAFAKTLVTLSLLFSFSIFFIFTLLQSLSARLQRSTSTIRGKPRHLVESSLPRSHSVKSPVEINFTHDSSPSKDNFTLSQKDHRPADKILDNESGDISEPTGDEIPRLEGASHEADEQLYSPSVSVDYEQLSSQVDKLIHDYHRTGDSNPPAESRFVLFRAIGNDLPPRHAVNQTYTNVKFILENEPKHPDLDVRWFVNRIVDLGEELRIVELLIKHRQVFTVDRLDYDKYAHVDFLFEAFPERDIFHSSAFRNATRSESTEIMGILLNDKNIFVINNNGARNAMLDLGLKSGAEYVLPWDGNCYLTQRAWDEIKKGIADVRDTVAGGNSNFSAKYFVVPMARMVDNDLLLGDGYKPTYIEEEPQIIFHKSATEKFNSKQRYGRRPKVDLLWRLQVPGYWDDWLKRDGHSFNVSTDVPSRGSVRDVGWVARLFSGVASLEGTKAGKARSVSRIVGIENLAAKASEVLARKSGYTEQTLMLYDEKHLEANRQSYRDGGNDALTKLVHELIKLADEELARDIVYTVADKPKAAPSEDIHDYFSQAPYFWPNSFTADGFPYVKKHGKRAPGTTLYDEESNKFDRTRLANFVRNATILSLAGYFTEDEKYSRKAAELGRTWFIDEKTRMNPNLNYAQMRLQSPNDKGSNVIDFVSVSVILDSVRLLYKCGVLTSADMAAVMSWFQEYAVFLQSKVCREDYYLSNNHGTLFDVQAAAIYAFTGNFRYLMRHTSLARSRMLMQFHSNGAMPEEMKQPAQLHYMFYGLQAWTLLAQMSERITVDMWSFKGKEHDDPILKRGAKFVVPYFARPDWSHRQENETDLNRGLYLYYMFRDKYTNLTTFTVRNHVVPPIPNSVFQVKPIFSDYFLIPPFWNLALSESL